jgi:hypothetical protein
MSDARLNHRTETLLSSAINAATEALVTDEKLRQDVNMYVSNGAKMAALLVPGGAGTVTSAAVHALDQIRIHDDLATKLVDGSLGALKGVVLRKALNGTDSLGLSPTAKALSLGISNRFCDTIFDRRAYVGADGEWNPSLAVNRAMSEALDQTALGIDFLTYGVSTAAVGGANKLTGGVISRNVFLSNAVTSGSFGFANGAYSELTRQTAMLEPLDLKSIAHKGFIQAGVDGLASLPGSMMTARLARLQTAQRVARAETTKGKSTISSSALEQLSNLEMANMSFPSMERPSARPTPERGPSTSIQVEQKTGAATGSPEQPPSMPEMLAMLRTWNETVADRVNRREPERRYRLTAAEAAEHALMISNRLSIPPNRKEQVAQQPMDSSNVQPRTLEQVMLMLKAKSEGRKLLTVALDELSHPAEINALVRIYCKIRPDIGEKHLRKVIAHAVEHGAVLAAPASVWVEAISDFARSRSQRNSSKTE